MRALEKKEKRKRKKNGKEEGNPLIDFPAVSRA